MKKSSSLAGILIASGFILWQFFQPSSQTVKTSQVDSPSDDDFGNYDASLRDDKIGQNKNAPTDYYMLVLSWSPAFCEEMRTQFGKNLPQSAQYQCTGKSFGWVVHGLWPQNANALSVADHPRFCRGDLPPLPLSEIQPYLNISPGAKLLQGEWEKHGACAFADAQSYFRQEQALFNALNLPTQEMKRNELFRWMKTHNPQLNNAYLKASRNELFICYDKNWQVMDCPR